MSNARPPFLTDPAAVNAWLALNCDVFGTVTIGVNGTVNVTGSVLLKSHVPYIEVQFTTVTGNFSCSDCTHLESLHGSPHSVMQDFVCTDCDSLITLEGAPAYIGENFFVNKCQNLRRLTGGPVVVSGQFVASANPNLESLIGGPTTVGYSYCVNNTAITSLVGAPSHVTGNFDCSYCNSLTTLEGAPAVVTGHFDCNNCENLVSFAGAPASIGNTLFAYACLQLASLVGVGRIGDSLIMTRRTARGYTFTAEDVAALVVNRIKVQCAVTTENSEAVLIVNEYYATGDLLTAMTQFEEHFKVPFTELTAASSDVALQVPEL